MDEDRIATESFVALADSLRSGRISPIDLVDCMLDRIARYDGTLHSYRAVAADAARIAARDAEAEIRAGRWRGPLHGVPLAIKDIFYTTAIRTGLGSPIYDGWTPPHDSTATRRLEAAGAILIGKLTATEGVYADHHPTIAPPLNPFGPDHWTGTSSSGSGVAVTAGLCYGTLGSDTGGSIRLPSGCCGVVGIKPTWGRVSRHGAFPLAESLDHVGPMARTVADATALLQAIAGPDPSDPTASPLPVPDYLGGIAAGIAGLRIGVDWSFVEAKAEAAVLRSLRAAAAVLADLGAAFVDVTMPPVEPVLRGWAVQCAVEAALAHRDTYPSRKVDYGTRLAALLERGRRITALEMAMALRDRRAFNGSMARLFANIDLMLVPALPVAGPSLAHMASLGEDPDAILAIGPFTAPFDVCGYPTITLPCGTSAAGIPIGFQIVGGPFAEDLLCRAGHAYQARTAWHLRRPDLTRFDSRKGSSPLSAMDMADMPVQFPSAPGTSAEARARFFNSGNAFNVKLPPVPARVFTAEPAEALASRTTRFLPCDQSSAIGSRFPATTPLMLARYATIMPGETLDGTLQASGAIWYVIRGHGTARVGSERIAFGAKDVILTPGGRPALFDAGTEGAVLWVVSNEPQLAFEELRLAWSDEGAIDVVHYPAREIARQLEQVFAASQNATTSGIALIFSSARQEGSRNITPSLTLSLNTVPPGEHQRSHRHNSAAITLILHGDQCYSTVENERCAWSPWATLVTPATASHSHHNPGAERAMFLIVQDGGLHYHARTMGFTFLEPALV